MSRSLYARLGRRFAPDRFNTSRRDALKAALATAAGLMLSGPPFACLPRTGKRVVIIGAGFSGLACALEVLAAGYDVTILEARGRISGRVLSLPDMIPGKNVEAGAELIGSNHPLWMAYAKRFDLGFLDVSNDESLAAPLVLNGQRLEAAKAKELFEAMDKACNLMNADAASVVEDQPWTTPNAAALDKRTTADWIQHLDVDPLCRLAVAAELTANNGVATIQQSYLGNLAQVKGGGLEKYWTDSEVYRCKGGNDQLAKHLAKAVGPDRIKLNTPVKSIELKPDRIAITTADGRTLECDDAVLTVPPSAWHKIALEPKLPGALAPQMGTNIKYISVVKKPFWLDGKADPYSLGDGDISMTWEATDAQNPQGPRALTAYSGGPGAAACLAREKDARDSAFHAQLESLYKGFKDNFVSARFIDWPNDPWTKAGYSFPAPGQVTTIGPLLRAGIGQPARLHFAGEHTCYKFVGYMEGALDSGAAVARRLAARDNVIVEPRPASRPDSVPMRR
jgi:monoamine oxidase